MGAMREFLERLDVEPLSSLYRDLDTVWNERARSLNERLSTEHLPVRVANLSTIWTICYTQPSRYNWMFQYYLREAGIALSWVGTGRLIFSLNYTPADFAEVAERHRRRGARDAEQISWWWAEPATTNKSLRRRVLKEILQARSPWLSGSSISSPRSR